MVVASARASRLKLRHYLAFSFGKGAYEEAARAKGAEGLTIILLTVADLLKGKADLVTPETGLYGTDTPLPEPRWAKSRRSPSHTPPTRLSRMTHLLDA